MLNCVRSEKQLVYVGHMLTPQIVSCNNFYWILIWIWKLIWIDIFLNIIFFFDNHLKLIIYFIISIFHVNFCFQGGEYIKQLKDERDIISEEISQMKKTVELLTLDITGFQTTLASSGQPHPTNEQIGWADLFVVVFYYWFCFKINQDKKSVKNIFCCHFYVFLKIFTHNFLISWKILLFKKIYVEDRNLSTCGFQIDDIINKKE